MRITKEFIIGVRIVLFILYYIGIFGVIVTAIDIVTDLTNFDLGTTRIISIFLSIFLASITKITTTKK